MACVTGVLKFGVPLVGGNNLCDRAYCKTWTGLVKRGLKNL